MSYLKDHGVRLATEKMYEDAKAFLQKAIKDGDKDAINDLGVVYQREGSYEAAVECYELSSALGCGMASCNLASLYEEGLGVEIDYEKAKELYEKAINQNEAYAFHLLANMYHCGKGVTKDDKKALEINLRGAKLERKSSREPKSISELSYYYDVGIGTKPNMKKTYKYSKMGALKGSDVATYNLALCYLYGKGTKKNEKKAIEYLMRGVRVGYPDSFYRLYELYRDGNGVKKDIDTANLWLIQAMKFQSFKAYLRYAEMCITGTGGHDVDYKVATRMIAKFYNEIDYSYTAELKQAEELKNKYPDQIDWDEIKMSPEKYLYGEVEVEVC